MKVLVYPHSMEIGGSQLNAIQLAGAIRGRGHEVIIASEPGALVAHVAAMGLEHIELPLYRSRPSPKVARLLGELVRQRGVDVVHCHEWPPIIDGFLAIGIQGGPVMVGTVMSMSVPPFLPRRIRLTVGTEAIRQAAIAAGYQKVDLLEPPVDTYADNPSLDGNDFRLSLGVARDEILASMVCRLVPDLKLEGLLSACRAVCDLAIAGAPVRLSIIGDGPARSLVSSHAEALNNAVGRRIIMIAGAMPDPRPAYAASDIIIGQGGSALRGMAFAKPLVVIGEDGFSELLTPESAPIFLHQGWYGLGPGSQGAGIPALCAALQRLIASSAQRTELGLFGRQLVERRFSLAGAARLMEEFYLAAARDKASASECFVDAAWCSARLFRYKLERKFQRWTGAAATDDANARTQTAAVLSSTSSNRRSATAG